jgi:hypothetical protein
MLKHIKVAGDKGSQDRCKKGGKGGEEGQQTAFLQIFN